MQSPNFIVNRQRIEDKKTKLVKTNVTEDGWVVEYEDKENGENWIEYRVKPEYHGGGYPILVKLPEPDTKELIRIALESENMDEIAGASIFLCTNERDKKIEFREKLILAIEDFYQKIRINSSDFDKKKIRTIIYESNLFDSTNLRPTIGKRFEEVEADYQFYKSISERSKEILNQIKEK